MDQDYEREEELKDQQDDRTFRVGRVLRATFPERDETLEPAMTRLMLELSRESRPERQVVPAEPVRGPAPSLFRRLALRLHLT